MCIHTCTYKEKIHKERKNLQRSNHKQVKFSSEGVSSDRFCGSSSVPWSTPAPLLDTAAKTAPPAKDKDINAQRGMKRERGVSGWTQRGGGHIVLLGGCGNDHVTAANACWRRNPHNQIQRNFGGSSAGIASPLYTGADRSEEEHEKVKMEKNEAETFSGLPYQVWVRSCLIINFLWIVHQQLKRWIRVME